MGHENIFAFVLTPIREDFHDIYSMGIKETAQKLGIEAERVDEQIFQEGILERIYRQIDAADIVIADMSHKNPNVFYEVGYAHAKEKLCILLTQDVNDIPFDLKHKRHIVYEGSISKLREALESELAWAASQIETARQSRVKVSLSRTSGNLERTRFFAKGEVDFKIDLHNESQSPSPDIEAVYFYSSSGWTLMQDGKICPQTESDIPGFSLRHFLQPPMRRLNKNSWAQLRFKSSKILALARAGDEIKDNYRITGRSILRLDTTKGNFDYELAIDVECDEIPF